MPFRYGRPIRRLRVTTTNVVMADGQSDAIASFTADGTVLTTSPNTPPVAVIGVPQPNFAATQGVPVTLDPVGTFDREGGWGGTWTVTGPGGVVRFTFSGTFGSYSSHVTTWTPTIQEPVTLSWAVVDEQGAANSTSISGTVQAAPAPTTVIVSPSTFALAPGGTQLLSATVRDQYGAAMSGQTIAWSSTASGVASVSPASGGQTTATGVAQGSVTVRATTASVSGTSAGTVSAAAAVPFFSERWTYVNDADWQGSAGAAKGWGGLTSGASYSNITFSTDRPYAGTSKWLKLTYPPFSPCLQPAVGRQCVAPAGLAEIWIEFAVRFSANWTTANPVANSSGCTTCGTGPCAPDHKLLRGHTTNQNSHWGFKDGHNGGAWNNSIPGAQSGFWDIDVAASTPYYDDQWHIVRLHWKTSNTNTAVYYFAIDGVVKNNWRTGNYPANLPLEDIHFGLNLNQGQQQSQYCGFGYIDMWDTSPGWG